MIKRSTEDAKQQSHDQRSAGQMPSGSMRISPKDPSIISAEVGDMLTENLRRLATDEMLRKEISKRLV